VPTPSGTGVPAQAAVRELKAAFEDCKVDTKEFIDVVGLLALLGLHLQPVIKQRNAAIEAYNSAKAALNEHFQDGLSHHARPWLAAVPPRPASCLSSQA
jgi:hypothetical protein